MQCSCGRVFVGMHDTGTTNWRPECQMHGVGSAWYNSDEQVEKRRKQREELVELYAKAREARQKVRG